MLKAYQEKRDFSKTPEPSGNGSGAPRDRFFIVQKHDARNLHYDFRIAVDGVLKSWAVPKGPSLNPADKRLAIQTEDHPLEYATFEGTIPKGQYGGGTVMLWDGGKFEPEGDPRRGLAKGKLKFHLEGEKLRGGFELVRMAKDSEKDQWLLLKRKDDAASDRDGAITKIRPKSVRTGRSLEEIARDNTARPNADPAELVAFLREQPAAKRLSKPPEAKPQLATLATKVPEGDRWLHEIKWDGYRFLAEKHAGRVRLWTRRRLDWTAKFPAIAEAVERLPAESFLLDCELVALDAKGRGNFQRLQNALRHGEKARLACYCFDLLYAEGFDLRKLPLDTRKEALKRMLPSKSRNTGMLRYSDHLEGNGHDFFQNACKIRLEGIIAKRRNAPYVSTRSRDWLKIKCTRRQEFVVCGFTPPTGSRRHFGSLALAVRENGTWRYAGQVGTGFDQDTLEELHARLRPLVRKSAPVDAPDAPSRITWTKPEIVVEIDFTEVTESGRLRHPSFQGIREDKKATEVTWEHAVAPDEDSTDSPPKKSPNKKKPARKTSTRAAPLAVPENADVAGIRISHPDREVFPDAGISKGELAVYYARAAERMLPYLANRPLSLLRCPAGARKQCFFQKHFRESVPASVELIDIVEKKGKEPYSYVTDASGIVSLAQYGVLEFHPWGSRIDKVERPDNLIFDLDPDQGVTWKDILAATFTLRDYLADLGLTSFLKVSGGKGLHVCVPIDRRTDWPAAREFCHNVALRLVEREPAKWVAQALKSKRKGKVFIDYLRNGRGATAIAPYSVRARQGAPVALPVDWDEATPELRPNGWNLRDAIVRIENEPDPWADFPKTRQSLTKATLDAVRQ